LGPTINELFHFMTHQMDSTTSTRPQAISTSPPQANVSTRPQAISTSPPQANVSTSHQLSQLPKDKVTLEFALDWAIKVLGITAAIFLVSGLRFRTKQLRMAIRATTPRKVQ
jgi:hypothetical protein